MEAGEKPSRRDFGRAVAASALLARPSLEVDQTPWNHLDEITRQSVSFPFDHPLRTLARNHWAITVPRIADLPAAAQRACRAAVDTVLSDDGARRLTRIFDEDGGGFESYHLALFGDPTRDGGSEWVVTGRHVTLRGDGRSGRLARGPIFLGHAAEGVNNVWSTLDRAAVRLFEGLDDRERLESGLEARERRPGPAGLAVDRLQPPAGGAFRELFESFAGLFRGAVFEPERQAIQGGKPGYHIAFFPAGAAEKTKTPTAWRVTGPGFGWYTHTRPHIHTWVEFPPINDGPRGG